MLLRLLGLSDDSTGTSDVVFVAIDFENAGSIWRGTSSKEGCQVGLAVLDTRQLEARRLGAVSCPDDKEDTFLEEPGELITTYNFATGPWEYCERVKSTKNFLFGKTVFINSNDIREKIESCIPPNRGIILVGHGLTNELKALDILKVNPKTCRIVSKLDTFLIAPQVSPKKFPSGSRKLCDLLRKLCCPYDALHVAGNDANFTLRALILLAAQATHHERREMSKFLVKFATTSSHYIGFTKQQKRAKKKEKQERRERRETRRAVNRDARAQRAAYAELQNEDSVLEEGDLLRLEDPWHEDPWHDE